MRISNNYYTAKILFRYPLNCAFLSSFFPKTLNPKTLHSATPSNSVITIYSLCYSSSGPSSFFSSESYPLQKRRSLSTSCSGSSSVIRFVLHSSNCASYSSYNVCSNSGWPHCRNMIRCYSISSSNSRSGANVCSKQLEFEARKFVLEIVDILRNNGEDFESRLNMLFSSLSVYTITEIFEVLNCERISGLRFFEWIRSNNPHLCKNAYVCSLIIDNLGRLDDYETMYAWIKKFSSEKICLSYEAFRFLPMSVCTNSSLQESTKKVVDLLDLVGGSCRISGVCALIEMFCKLHLFEMAKYVIKITESKASYYCLLIREKCRIGLIEDAYNIIKEMGQAHCVPNTTVYNCILGSLWKNGRMDEASTLLNEMKENSIPSDAITFEILINSECSLGNIDVVHKLINQMVSQGLEPRHSTHVLIIKTLFAAEKYEAAYKHVVDSSVIYKRSSNVMYSLLASLYREKGDIKSARNTLVEMMDKSLKPNFSIYIKIVKQLRRTGKANLARDLEMRHSRFHIKSRAGVL